MKYLHKQLDSARQMIIMIKANIFQPLLGCKEVQFYPYIRKIDLMSSNSYILSGEEQIALIDVGALDDQFDCLVENIASLLNEKPRPVVVYLTHAHLDHCLQLNRLRKIRDIGDVAIAAQEIGAEALERQDPELTLAGLLGKKLAQISVDIRLLCKQDVIAGRKLEIKLNTTKFSYFTDSLKTRYGPVLHSQTISIGGGSSLEIYSIPGHSPDSICVRAGGLLFTGDLFFAPNPGVAGAFGWNKSQLIKSIYKVMWILEKKDILYCCSGHGRIIDVGAAEDTLKSMYQDILSLSGLEEITPQWAKSTAAYAEDLMRELERLFAIIIGRLTYISHILEELEESREAEILRSLINVNQIDGHFQDFNRFAQELHKGNRGDWDLVHKAGQIIRNLDLIFESKRLESVLDKSHLTRAKSLLNDYAIVYRGFRPAYYAENVEINNLLNEVVEFLQKKPYEDDTILEANHYDDFVLALRARIGHIDIFKNIYFNLITDESLPLARMDRGRFIDAVLDLLERLPSAGADEIQLTTSIVNGWVSICISAKGWIQHHPLDEHSWRFFEREFALCGGIIRRYKETERSFIVEIEFVPNDSSLLKS